MKQRVSLEQPVNKATQNSPNGSAYTVDDTRKDWYDMTWWKVYGTFWDKDCKECKKGRRIYRKLSRKSENGWFFYMGRCLSHSNAFIA